MKKFIVNYFLCFFFFCTFFASGFIDSQDGFEYLAVARRMYYDHTIELPSANWDDETNIVLNADKGRDGKRYPITGIGYTLAFLPSVAVEDLFLHFAHVSPIQAFPLQNDWPVLLFASMTNGFFGALFVVTLYAYLRSLQITHRTSVILSFILTVSSNVFVYTKHSFAHMMFLSFLLLTFYWLRKATLTKQRRFLVGAGLSFGVVATSYNQSFIFTILPLGLFYLLQLKLFPSLSLKKVASLGQDILAGLVGATPFILLYLWYNYVRFGGNGISADSSGSLPVPQIPPAYIFFEGIWSLLFSPGKSIFLFSPILLLIIIFWFKLPRKVLPEIVAVLSLSSIYVYFIGTYMGGVDFPVWHGDSSWGPRYLLPILPLSLVLGGVVISRLRKLQIVFVAVPLLLIGMGVSLLGTVVPYQVRFYGLPTQTYINGEKFSVSLYGNIIPRYSPVFLTGKLVAKRLIHWRTLFSHGKFNVKLADGFDRPFDVGFSVWREPLDSAVITFDNPSSNSVNDMSLQFRNFLIDPQSSVSASLSFRLNGKELPNSQLKLKPDQESEAQLVIPKELLHPTENRLEISKQFNQPVVQTVFTPDRVHNYKQHSEVQKKQVIFLQILRINKIAQPITTLDYPYVSPISQSLFNKKYTYFGNQEKNPWTIWHMHSSIYEASFDFWWLRPFHYWDMPKDFFFGLFVVNSAAFLYFGWRTVMFESKE